MRKIRVTQLFFLSCCLILMLALDELAQAPGGYRLVSNDDPESVAAAKVAVRLEGEKLGKNIVFSGTNYKLCLKVKVNGTSKRAETVIHRNMQKEYALTSWKWGECTKPAELRTSPPATPPGR